jgi:type VI secretion system protein VasJ
MIASDRNWQWSSFGKHPAVKDYFKMGQNSALAKVFSDWVETGYQGYGSKRRSLTEFCSWRFWSRGPERESLVCGLVRDSTDSLGRPYPLFIMGTGSLKGWEDQWDLLSFACGRTWDQMEYLSTQVVNDFKKLEAGLQNIRPPSPEWPALSLDMDRVKESLLSLRSASPSGDGEVEALEREISELSEKAEIFIGLDGRSLNPPISLVDLCHFLLRANVRVVPNAIFMGGSLETNYFAAFRRPLTQGDFIRFWSVSSAGPSLLPSPPVEEQEV